MVEKRKDKLLTADTIQSGVGSIVKRADGGVRAVGQIGPLEIGPKRLDGVEFGRVRGKALDLQPVRLGGEELEHELAAMGGEAVPEQGHALAVEVTAEVFDELDQAFFVVRARLGLEVEAGALAVPAVAEGRGRRDPLPPEPVGDDRGLTSGSPGAADGGGEGKTGLVLEDDPAPFDSGVFFTSSQVPLTQSWIAASSRSAARRAGFCRLQPRERRMRQTCPGW